MDPIRLELTDDLFENLISRWTGERSTLSPLKTSQSSSPLLDQKLQQAGILSPPQVTSTCPGCGATVSVSARFCGSCGKVIPVRRDPPAQLVEPYVSLLSSLAKPDFYADLCLARSEEQKTITLYSSRAQDAADRYSPTAVIAGDSDHIVLLAPFTQADLVAELGELATDSSQPQSELNANLDPQESLILAALVDMERQVAAIRERLTPEASDSQPEWTWDDSLLLRALQRDEDADASLWIISTPLKAMLPDQNWSLPGVQQATARLIHRRLVCQLSQGKYALADDVKHLVNHLLTVHTSFWLSARQAADENDELPAMEEELIGFCSEKTNLLFFYSSNGEIKARTLAGRAASDAIGEKMFAANIRQAVNFSATTCPRCGNTLSPGTKFCGNCGAPTGVATSSPPAPTSVAVTCSHCGSPLKPSLKFCEQCGAPTAPEPPPAPLACPQCGSPIRTGVKFCGNCGAKLA